VLRGRRARLYVLDLGSLVTYVLVAAAIALVLCAAGLAVVLGSRRSARRANARVAEVVELLNERMDALARGLQQARERAEDESRRNRFLGELSGSLDLDDVLTRVLEAATSLPGVHAAIITMSGVGGKPVVATLGLSEEEAEQQTIANPPDRRVARSIALVYQYPPDELQNGHRLIHSGLAVPLPGTSEQLGFLTIYSRESTRTFEEDDLAELESLAQRAGPAIENARRFREARQLADLDALTGLHNRRYFHETLAREVARAHRYQRRLGLIVLDLDDFKEVNDKIGHLAGDGVLADAAGRIRDVVRSADIACRVGGDEFAVILPESGLEDTDQLYRRIQGSVAARPVGQAGALHFSAGVAELREEDDAVSFFQRADEALYRAKDAGKGTVVAATNTG
jgi:diguanylate cyclase (GGDEF)-like protein